MTFAASAGIIAMRISQVAYQFAVTEGLRRFLCLPFAFFIQQRPCLSQEDLAHPCADLKILEGSCLAQQSKMLLRHSHLDHLVFR